MSESTVGAHAGAQRVSLWRIIWLWTRLGVTGFGGPQAHIVMLRDLMVTRHQWMSTDEFEHAVATVNLLPGPASTQLAMYCAWKLRRSPGAVLGGLCFIIPGLIAILIASIFFLGSSPPGLLLGAALGAGAVIPLIALRAGIDLGRPAMARVRQERVQVIRFFLWGIVGLVSCLLLGPLLVLALLFCGVAELLIFRAQQRVVPKKLSVLALLVIAPGSVLPIIWTALKVGALSFGGGFVIIPLMQADAVHRYHWMTNSQFLTAVALGQLTPGPVVQTVAAVGYAAGGLSWGVLAAVIAFAPSFLFILFLAPSFEAIRNSPSAQAFLRGAGPAAIGAILGTSVLLALGFVHLWQLPIALIAAVWLLVLKRGTPLILLTGALLGILAVVTGLPH